MNIGRTGSKKGHTTFTSNASGVTPGQMRSSACKMIRALVSLMRTLKPLPEERTIVTKLLYYDDVTPGDYEPSFFKCHVDNEAINLSKKNLLKIEMGNANGNELVLKLKGVFDPCDENNSVTSIDDVFSESEVIASGADFCTMAPYDDTKHAANEEVLAAQVKSLTFSSGVRTDNVLDDLSNFRETSVASKKKSGYVLVSSSKKINFILDSGATHHVCNGRSIMCNLKDVKEEDQVTLFSADGKELKAEMMGSVVTKDVKLGQVGYIPQMAFNVVSIGQLAIQGLLINIADGHFSVIEPKEAKLVGEGYLQKKRDKADDSIYYEYVIRTMMWDIPNDDVKLVADEQNNEC